MMRVIAFLAAVVGCAMAQSLPTLNTICRQTLTKTYSCGGSYGESGLYLAKEDEPVLLYNGACNAKPYFEAALAGDDFALISDLGEFPLVNVSSHLAFNPTNIAGHDSDALKDVPVVANHTYSAFVSRSNLLTVFVFQVVDFNPTGGVTLDVAVREYVINKEVAGVPGFNWTATNVPAQEGECFPDVDFPVLQKICKTTVEKPYSCGGSYNVSAVFFGSKEVEANTPDLLFNGGPTFGGGCENEYVESMSAWGFTSRIGPSATYPISLVSAHRAFNYENIVGFDNVFQLDSTIKPYNTYAMLAHTSRFRILATFAIEDTGPSGAGPYSVEFAVLNYQQMAQVSASSGFSWEQQNSQGTSEQCNSGR